MPIERTIGPWMSPWLPLRTPARSQRSNQKTKKRRSAKMSDKSLAVQTAQEPRSLSLVEPQTLVDRISRIHENIARRAFEIFQADGGPGAKDLEHWFRAEADILHPAHITINESEEAVNVHVEVPGFNANDLQVSLAPSLLTISGKRQTRKETQDRGKKVYQEKCCSELLRIIDLPAEVDAAKTTATLKEGILSLSMPKATQAKVTRVAVKMA
jgi:HSP20 family protein